ncbi:hypothetical protein [[Clostridium] polysaccharolyticum]|uniref:Uncharacterized protein n=1 Tax=[Clostridium] polysaccharolyticum TaxID=29364 RepID=A0A1I0D1V1_9FIRM|nr:hypothetical protein [[Clostridium] polysaccharolyticum]SET26061.1 hypothetical protein SAMN04487772_11270 [[Clostridium] polysaccharolyticum]
MKKRTMDEFESMLNEFEPVSEIEAKSEVNGGSGLIEILSIVGPVIAYAVVPFTRII